MAGLSGVRWLYLELLWLLLREWLYTWSCCGWLVWGRVIAPRIVVSAAGGMVVYLECCGWPVWGKVPVPGIVVSAAGGAVERMVLLWLACVGKSNFLGNCCVCCWVVVVFLECCGWHV